jgi:hypothetical protein
VNPLLSYKPGVNPPLSYKPGVNLLLSYKPGVNPLLSYKPGGLQIDSMSEYHQALISETPHLYHGIFVISRTVAINGIF